MITDKSVKLLEELNSQMLSFMEYLSDYEPILSKKEGEIEIALPTVNDNCYTVRIHSYTLCDNATFEEWHSVNLDYALKKALDYVIPRIEAEKDSPRNLLVDIV